MKVGSNTKIYPLTNLYCESIGDNCMIASFVEIGRGVKIGNGCRVQAQTFIPEGVTIGDNVFIGPQVCFINCRYPQANRKTGTYDIERIVVEDNVVIGAASTIMCGVVLGEGCFIGAGSMITKSVPPKTKVFQKRMLPSVVDIE